MYIQKDYLEKILQQETRFEENGVRLYVECLPVGELALPTGVILLADPYEMNRGIRAYEGLAPGRYPAYLHFLHEPPHDDKVAAYFVLRFSEKKADRFVMCLPEGIDIESLGKDGFYGVQTQSGNVSVLDEKTAGVLITQVEGSETLLQSMENQLGLSYFDCGGFADVLVDGNTAEEATMNFMTMVAGGEAGGFPAYVAYHGDEPVAFIIDFLALGH